jgi:hypothetical protein
MEVTLLPRPVGCLWIPLQVMTLGLATLLLRSAEGKFPRRMDDQGVETRSDGAEDHCRGSDLLLSQGTFLDPFTAPREL